jgi:proteic killer suppression protein
MDWVKENRESAGMEVEFGTKELERLATDPEYTADYPPEVLKTFRRRVQFIDAAPNDLALRNMRSLRFEKLKGGRAGQRSIRLNDQWRIILVLRTEQGQRVARILSIEDYH